MKEFEDNVYISVATWHLVQEETTETTEKTRLVQKNFQEKL